MNQQNSQNQVYRTAQRRGAGAPANMSGATPQANPQFGFGSAQAMSQGQSTPSNPYGQQNPYNNSVQPFAEQQYQSSPAQQPYQAGMAQPNQEQGLPQQQYAQPAQMPGGQVVQAMPVTVHEQKWADTTYTNATFGQRVGAYLIDSAIIGIIQAVILTVFMGGAANSSTDEAATGMILIGAIIVSVISVAYKIGMEGAMGQTLGKKVLKLRLITTDDRPMGFGHAFKRNFNLFYGGIPLVGSFVMLGSLIGRFVSVMNSPYSQGYHDRWGNTRLIKES